MQPLRFFSQKNAQYGRFLPFAFLSAAVAFLGFGNGDKANDEAKSFFDDGGLIPRAHADVTSCTSCTSCTDCGACGDCGACNCGCCFPESALVMTESGPKNISDIGVGDVVISYNEAEKTFTTSIVEKTIVHNEANNDPHDFASHPLMKVVYEQGGESKEMTVTGNHPVLKVTSNTYEPIESFAVGDALVTQAGEATITAIETMSEESMTVYNLSLTDGPHTYIADGIVVHNKNCDCSGECGDV